MVERIIRIFPQNLELKTEMCSEEKERCCSTESRLGGQLLETSEVWLVKHKEYSPKASGHRIIPVSPGNPLWAHIILLPADHGDVAADDPLQQVGHKTVYIQGRHKAEAWKPDALLKESNNNNNFAWWNYMYGMDKWEHVQAGKLFLCKHHPSFCFYLTEK